MARVYSAPLFEGLLVGPIVEEITVPADETWIIRDVTLALLSTSAAVAQVGFIFNAIALALWLVPPGWGGDVHWEGRVAGPGGTVLIVVNDTAGVTSSIWMSGYKLTP